MKNILATIFILISISFFSQKYSSYKKYRIEKILDSKSWSSCSLSSGSVISIDKAKWGVTTRYVISYGNNEYTKQNPRHPECNIVVIKMDNGYKTKYEGTPINTWNLNSWRNGMPNLNNGFSVCTVEPLNRGHFKLLLL